MKSVMLKMGKDSKRKMEVKLKHEKKKKNDCSQREMMRWNSHLFPYCL